MNNMDSIGNELVSNLLYEIFNLHPILRYHGTEADEDGKYSTLAVINSSEVSDYITPEELSNKLHIVLKTSARTLKSTESQFICSTSLLARRFSTNKAHFRYKQLAKVFGSLYADYLKSKKIPSGIFRWSF